MAKFFGTNGIRGVFGQDLTLEFVHDMTCAIGTFLGGGPILVAYDGRTSSPILLKVVCSALNSIGIDCHLADLVPTPCLEYGVKSLGCSGGIMITASHNPPQYNGLKPVASDGVEISREDELAIEQIYLQKQWLKPTRWGKEVAEPGILAEYIGGILSHIPHDHIVSSPFTIVLDLGNGMQTASAPLLATLLGCNVTLINDEIDGDFPGRGPEPTPQNLSTLSNMVIERNADLGIAFDGDGDRSIFCDERGNIITGDASALVLASHILKKRPKSTIVTCLNSSSGIDAIAAQSNSTVIRTKVGSVNVSRMMLQSNALIGFEENGGFMYAPHNQVRDGGMALALMLDTLASSGKALSEHVSALPVSFTTKDKISCPAQHVPALISTLEEEFPDADTTDGIRISFDYNQWVMIRPSGTEPIVRIYAEAKTKNNLDFIMSKYMKKVSQILDSMPPVQ